MKRILIVLCTIYPLFAHADIIATFNNGNIEDVTVVSVGVDEVVYNEGDAQKSIVSSQVEGILYDDGRFVTPPNKAAVTESVEPPSGDSWAVDDATSQMLTDVDSNGYLICAADHKSYTGWNDLVILGFVLKQIPQISKDFNLKEKIEEQQKYFYSLCILKEDVSTYKLYLKNHKDIKKLLKKASDEMSYEIALPASRVYKAKKEEGASSEEAVAAFINTYIESYNQSKNQKQ